MKTATKRKLKSPYKPQLNKDQVYELLKKNIIETAKTSEEYELRVQALAKKLRI